MVDDFLTQGIAAVKAGNKQEARLLLSSAIHSAPNDERTWGWFYNVCENDEERLRCVKEILRINPNNERAKQKYDELTGLGFQTLSVTSPKARIAEGNSAKTIQQVENKKGGISTIEWTIIGIVGGAAVIILVIIGILILVKGISSPVANIPAPLTLSTSSVTPILPSLRPSLTSTLFLAETSAQTDTPKPTNTSQPTNTQIPPKPVGTLRVNNWQFEITAIHSDPGMNSSRQWIVLLGNLTNEGASTDTFTAYAIILLRDSQGRQYEEDDLGTYAVYDKYGTQIPASINPGATDYIGIAYDTPSSEKSFTIIPGSLVVSWSNNITFTIP